VGSQIAGFTPRSPLACNDDGDEFPNHQLYARRATSLMTPACHAIATRDDTPRVNRATLSASRLPPRRENTLSPKITPLLFPGTTAPLVPRIHACDRASARRKPASGSPFIPATRHNTSHAVRGGGVPDCRDGVLTRRCSRCFFARTASFIGQLWSSRFCRATLTTAQYQFRGSACRGTIDTDNVAATRRVQHAQHLV
jgi:hypothetical protein